MTKLYTYRYRATGEPQTAKLALEWEANFSAGPYDDGLHGREAWRRWITEMVRYRPDYAEQVPIYWFVRAERPDSGGTFEGAPFTGHREDWLTYFTWPEDVNGEPLDWIKLPVSGGKSDWLEELTGWRPAPFTPVMPVRAIAAARGLWLPHKEAVR